MSGHSTDVPPIVHEALRSPGQPLDGGTRAYMERHFGYDFSRVRVHNDAKAGESARAMHALAYTLGPDLVFATGRYNPVRPTGKRLLAHELAHVVQQRDGDMTDEAVSVPSSIWEREADASAEEVMAGRHASAARSAGRLWLARKMYEEKKTLPQPDGSVVIVQRQIKKGKCLLVPESRTESSGHITAKGAFLELNLCYGSMGVSAEGKLDYGEALKNAEDAVRNLLDDLAAGKKLGPSTRKAGEKIKEKVPEASFRLNTAVPGFRAALTGTIQPSSKGMRGEVTAGVEADIGSRSSVGVGVTLRGGKGERTSVGGMVTYKRRFGPGGENLPDCRVCRCSNPAPSFICWHRPPARPEALPPKREPIILPLFFKFEEATPRPGWEKRFDEVLELAVKRIGEGYSIDRIEGSTSPEGPEKARKKGGFSNIGLAKARADEAHKRLQKVLKEKSSLFKMRGLSIISMRGRERINAALGAKYKVMGKEHGELFGRIDDRELKEHELPGHLLSKLGVKSEEAEQELAKVHIISRELPPDVAAEVKAQIEEFRTTKRMEAIYQPMRRALIFLKPPSLPPKRAQLRLSEKALQKVLGIGDPIPCRKEYLTVFKPLPKKVKVFEGECKGPGWQTRGGEVR